jgi:hypothetical protein
VSANASRLRKLSELPYYWHANDETLRIERRAVGAFGTAVAAGEAVGRMMTTVGSSTAFSGSSTAVRPGAVRPGATCRGTMVGTVSSRFYRWRRSGVWQHVLEALQALADAQGRVGWELHFLDSTVVRAHQHAAGGRKTGREPGAEDEALGRSRGGFTTKIHLRCEGYGKPVTFTLTGGQVHDSTQVSALISRGAIRRIGRGRLRPTKMVGDKAYSRRSIRLALRKRGIIPVIRPTSAASPASTARHTASATSASA